MVGGDGAVAFANRSARQLVGGDGESLIGRRFDDLVPTAVRGAWQALPAAAKREGALPFPPTIRIPLPGGGERIVEAVLDDRT
ncbi:MAG: fold, partial [Thermomicrobiales bacterium]|nr:fold [Thermomicrobiales bacterium]